VKSAGAGIPGNYLGDVVCCCLPASAYTEHIRSGADIDWATVCRTVRPTLSDRCVSCLSCPVCDVGVLWPNSWMDQDATWYGGKPWPRPHCVRWGPSTSPLKKGHDFPIFGPCLLWLNGWIDQEFKMSLGTEIGLGPGDIVSDGDLAPPPSEKGHGSPHFSAHVCCGQTARWIRMPLGMKVGIGQGDIVLHGDPTPPPFSGRTPILGA